MNISKLVIGAFLTIAAFMGVPEGMEVSDLSGGALYGFLLMLIGGIALILWGLSSSKKEDSEK